MPVSMYLLVFSKRGVTLREPPAIINTRNVSTGANDLNGLGLFMYLLSI